jgi:hypothetical protein
MSQLAEQAMALADQAAADLARRRGEYGDDRTLPLSEIATTASVAQAIGLAAVAQAIEEQTKALTKEIRGGRR